MTSLNESYIPSPAVSIIGRQNSGKTTLVEKIIAGLSAENIRIGTIKHHGHPEFDIDIPGKDSYRHRAAGAQASAILSSKRLALIGDLEQEMSCFDVLDLMPNFDLIIIEGFRGVGLPTIELFRNDNPKDQAALPAFVKQLRASKKQDTNKDSAPLFSLFGTPISDSERENDTSNSSNPDAPAIPNALVTDIPLLHEEAKRAHVPVFSYNDLDGILAFIKNHFVRKPITIAIQAGGESRRMGYSKALMPFLGEPLVEHMINLVKDFADELIVTTNESERLRYLETKHPHLSLREDLCGKRGSLQGLLTAMHYSSNEITGVVACDMIAFPPRILARESYVMQIQACDIVVPRNRGFLEPFAGVYRTSVCKKALEEAIATGTQRIKDFFSGLNCCFIDASPLQRPGHINPFANINTQEELTQAELLYRFYQR